MRCFVLGAVGAIVAVLWHVGWFFGGYLLGELREYERHKNEK